MYVNKINAQSQNKTNILQQSTVVNNFIQAIRSKCCPVSRQAYITSLSINGTLRWGNFFRSFSRRTSSDTPKRPVSVHNINCKGC